MLIVIGILAVALALLNAIRVTRRVHRIMDDAERFLTESRNAARETAQAKDQLLATMSHELRTPVNGVMVRLRQILVNLLDHAVAFTEHGRITIDVRLSRSVEVVDAIEIRVTDTGVGIVPELQRRLFGLFVRGDEDSTSEFRGTGLGLAICRRLADLMNGTMGFESTPGAGSTFWVRLPTEPVAGAEPVGSAGGSPETPVRALVVEDDAVNQMVLVKMLERLGHEGVVASHGREALDAIERHDVDVILMDVKMPVMDGIQATRAIRSRQDRHARVPIIAVTAIVAPDDIAEYLAAGMDGHLAKPVSLATLRESLTSVASASTSASQVAAT